MEYELDVMRSFDSYRREKRAFISGIEDAEQKACQEKVLVARSLLYQEAAAMVSHYSKYKSITNQDCEVADFKNKMEQIDSMDVREEFIRECEMNQKMPHRNQTQFTDLQEAMLCVICAGLEDVSFNKWKGNLVEAMRQVQSLDQVSRLPRFSNACGKVLDSLDIDFSDIEEELRLIFEPECIYNTLILMVTAVKLYSEIVQGIYDNRKKDMKVQHHRAAGKTNKKHGGL
ncbi:MAG: hypothetical protein K1W36_12805 [Lachnospiraceae bacterium]|jgi:hypothetical protein|nr:hypothetical protein [Lachnospiraceae bacterium]